MLYKNADAYTDLLYIKATTIAITNKTPIVTPIAGIKEVPSMVCSFSFEIFKIFRVKVYRLVK